MRQRCASLSPAQRDAAAAAVARQAMTFKANVWFVYVSTGTELATHDLIRALLAAGRTVAVPRTQAAGMMQAHLIADFAQLKPMRFGLLEPDDDCPVVEPDLALVPCVAVTRAGVRLGRGGGYYDRYLANHPNMTSIALVYDQQVVEALPTQPHDQRVQGVLTPTELTWVS